MLFRSDTVRILENDYKLTRVKEPMVFDFKKYPKKKDKPKIKWDIQKITTEIKFKSSDIIFRKDKHGQKENKTKEADTE